MKPPKSITHGGVGELTPADIRLEIRDILLSALQRWKAAKINPQAVANKLDKHAQASVHASR